MSRRLSDSSTSSNDSFITANSSFDNDDCSSHATRNMELVHPCREDELRQYMQNLLNDFVYSISEYNDEKAPVDLGSDYLINFSQRYVRKRKHMEGKIFINPIYEPPKSFLNIEDEESDNDSNRSIVEEFDTLIKNLEIMKKSRSSFIHIKHALHNSFPITLPKSSITVSKVSSQNGEFTLTDTDFRKKMKRYDLRRFTLPSMFTCK